LTHRAVLVVEDNTVARWAVADHLRACGHNVVEAESGDDAVAILGRDPRIGFIFSDIQLPGSVDGIGLARWAHDHRPGVPILLTSGHEEAVESAGRLAGCGAPLTKPYDFDVVERRVASALDECEDDPDGGTSSPDRPNRA
jgi:DNA-binding NtrC family response regulator